MKASSARYSRQLASRSETNYKT